ncbi:hypothetical protein EVAR_78903_1 [Eumeta japonica]|uniref:Uncharacterized protein n=1 Tax=Eumeta variegata TaxID=151549 RepID=A0A4C1U3X4_EUMVA|nr:hypothetical protein EVAR_78903_1 [Eumeta japonica]
MVTRRLSASPPHQELDPEEQWTDKGGDVTVNEGWGDGEENEPPELSLTGRNETAEAATSRLNYVRARYVTAELENSRVGAELFTSWLCAMLLYHM